MSVLCIPSRLAIPLAKQKANIKLTVSDGDSYNLIKEYMAVIREMQPGTILDINVDGRVTDKFQATFPVLFINELVSCIPEGVGYSINISKI
ncbi:MAG: hypothetical protein E7G34_24245 [Klebsiella pneumoniae]|nr:hypothetical protein [Klebsiella pneumoniae]